MTPQLPSPRAADEFARALDGTGSTAVADRYAELTRTVALLEAHPRPSPRADFVADLRQQLMIAAEEVLVPAAARPRPATVRTATVARPRRRERRLGAVAAALAIVAGTAGVATAAQSALPGSSLYPLKRGIESVELSINQGNHDRGNDLLSQADTRLSELHSLVASPNRTSPALVDQTLSSFTSSINRGSTLLFDDYQSGSGTADISKIRAFVAQAIAQLKSLSATAPPGTSGSFTQAADALAEIDQQARSLCASCSSRAAVQVPTSLADYSSARSLQALVVGPSQQASQLRAEAARAQHAAEREARAGGTVSSSGSSTATSGDTSTGSSKGSGSLSHPTSAATGSVTKLLKGLTGTVATLPGELQTTVDGVTTTVDGTLGEVTKGVTGLLGHKTK